MVDEPSGISVSNDDSGLTADERRHPSGGWGSVGAVTSILLKEGVALTGARRARTEVEDRDRQGDVHRADDARERRRHGHRGDGVLRLTTIRSDDQFNTTLYSLDDRFRGVSGSRRVLLMHADDMQALGLQEGDAIRAEAIASDGVERVVDALRAKRYDIPRGCVAGYYPGCNPLIPLSHHAKESKMPAAKAIPIRVTKTELAKA